MSKAPALTDTQLVLLSAASQREDGLLVQPDRLKGITAHSVTSKLLASGCIEEVTVSHNQPHWRQSENGPPIGFKITPAGLAAIGLSHSEEIEPDNALQQPQEPDGPRPEEPSNFSNERPGTKRALVIILLQREEGADLDDLIQATGWLPHTTRAALTGLRQKGYILTKEKGASGRTTYFIKAPVPSGPEGESGAQTAPAGRV